MVIVKSIELEKISLIEFMFNANPFEMTPENEKPDLNRAFLGLIRELSCNDIDTLSDADGESLMIGSKLDFLLISYEHDFESSSEKVDALLDSLEGIYGETYDSGLTSGTLERGQYFRENIYGNAKRYVIQTVLRRIAEELSRASDTGDKTRIVDWLLRFITVHNTGSDFYDEMDRCLAKILAKSVEGAEAGGHLHGKCYQVLNQQVLDKHKINYYVDSTSNEVSQYTGSGEKYFKILEYNTEGLPLWGSLKKQALRILQDGPKPGDIPAGLHDFIKKNDDAFLYRRELAGYFNSINPNKAKLMLLELMAQANLDGNEHLAETVKNILFRLELGTVPIYEHGMDYLGNSYDLGVHNDSSNYGQRLTSDGKMGIFSKGSKLISFFEEIGPGMGLKISPEMKSLSIKDLFYPEPDASVEREAERSKVFELVKDAFGKAVAKEFLESTGYYFSDFSLRQQAVIIQVYISLDNEAQKSDLYDLIRNHGEAAVSSLIAVTQGVLSLNNLNLIDHSYSGDFEFTHYENQVMVDYHDVVVYADNILQALAPYLADQSAKSSIYYDGELWLKKMLKRANDYLLESKNFAIEEGVVDWDDSDGEAAYGRLKVKMTQKKPHLKLQSCKEAVYQSISADLANLYSAEEIRILLASLGEIGSHIGKYLYPDAPGEALEDLKELYGRIKFEEYALNLAMANKEIPWLKDKLGDPKDKKILDAGCGTGRFTMPLYTAGYDVSAVDLSSRHVDYVNHQAGKELAVQSDWVDMPYPDGEFSEVISMGRNILHEHRIDRQKMLFKEINRILKTGGLFIFDIPDINRPHSHYKHLADSYSETMEGRGIYNTRHGIIYDSPDDRYFATRYVFSHDDILALAEDAGFEIVSVETSELPTDKFSENNALENDANIYYTLKKISDVDSVRMALAA